MTAATGALRLGLHRGWRDFVQSVRSPQDQAWTVFMALGAIGYLFLRRDDRVPGTELLFPSFALPSLLGMLLVWGVVLGPAYQLAMDREDGTLLRYKAIPHGLRGYFTSQLTLYWIAGVPQLLLVVVPALVLFDDVMLGGASGWLTVAAVFAVGLLAMMPIGIIIGALAPSVQKVGTLGMLPVLLLTAISGIFVPVTQLWGWVQVLAQVFPTYWIGLGMRSAFLPDSAAAAEIGNSWHTPETFLVLAAWAVAGWLVTPIVLRRMSQRISGSQIAQARETAGQWVK